MDIDWLANPLVLGASRHSSSQISLIKASIPEDLVRQELLIVPSSGTTSHNPKYIVHTKSNFFSVAKAANSALGVNKSDAWINVLPLYHVGGLATWARARVDSLKFRSLWNSKYKWHAHEFIQELKGFQWTSLVPTQLHDIVQFSLPPPISLKGVLLGGAPPSENLINMAIKLGWPIIPCFGMTETGSFFALAKAEFPLKYKPLPDVEISVNASELYLRSPRLFKGYIYTSADEKGVKDSHFERTPEWWPTEERVDLNLQTHEFMPLGRTKNFVKILGEGVQIEWIEEQIRRLLGPQDGSSFRIDKIPDERRGYNLVLTTSADQPSAAWQERMNEYNSQVKGPWKILSLRTSSEVEITNALGKLKRHSD